MDKTLAVRALTACESETLSKLIGVPLLSKKEAVVAFMDMHPAVVSDFSESGLDRHEVAVYLERHASRLAPAAASEIDLMLALPIASPLLRMATYERLRQDSNLTFTERTKVLQLAAKELITYLEADVTAGGLPASVPAGEGSSSAEAFPEGVVSYPFRAPERSEVSDASSES